MKKILLVLAIVSLTACNDGVKRSECGYTSDDYLRYRIIETGEYWVISTANGAKRKVNPVSCSVYYQDITLIDISFIDVTFNSIR